MLSNQILTSCHKLVQKHYMPSVGKARQGLFSFGLRALSLKPITSLNANARSVIANRNTAESTMTRLLHNERLAGEMSQSVGGMGLVTSTSRVNFDHTDHDGLTALVGAVQTGRGRAVPCFASATISGKLPAHDDAPPRKKAMRKAYTDQAQKLTDQTIQGLKQFRSQCGFWPQTVFDRWYGYEDLVKLLLDEAAVFYVRMKAGRFVELFGDKLTIAGLAFRDQVIKIYGRRVRLVVSPRGNGYKEPWYILTSDLRSSAQQVIKVYYHRFEIEESFKDIKHLRYLEHVQLQRALSFEILLWFIILGIILLYLAGCAVVGKRGLVQQSGSHPKKRLSWFRWLTEQLDTLLWQPVYDLLRGKSLLEGRR